MTAIITKNLPLLAGAPNGIKKLRELILELAVRGKLLPQGPGDEPASALLGRVAAERSAKSIPTQKQAVLFDLPRGWVWVSFGDVAQHNAGKTLDRGRNQGVMRYYITTSNLSWGCFSLENLKQMAITESELERCTARKNDLLICEGGEAGRAAVWEQDRDICFQNHVHRARLYGGINPYYVYRVFERLNATGEINNFRKGIAISNMSGKALASVPLPLPPIAEQHRIVAKVDELMALCDRLEAGQADVEVAHTQLVQALLDSLTQAADAADFVASWQRLSEHFNILFTTEASIDALKKTITQLAVMGKLVSQDPNDEPAIQLLKHIAEDKAQFVVAQKLKKQKAISEITLQEIPFNLPKNWCWARAEDISLAVVDCPHSTPKFVRTGKLCLDTNSFKEGELSKHRLRFVDEPTFDERNRRLQPLPGDIVFAREGSVGESIVIPDEMECCLGQRVMLFRVSRVNPHYFRLTISEPSALSRMLALHKGIGAKHINVADMRASLIALPPLAEQNRIVAKVNQFLALCDQLKHRLSQARQVHEYLAEALVSDALNASEKLAKADVINFSAYVVSKLASQRTFGRVAHMKLLFLADLHLSLNLMEGYRRHAAGPLDTSIYQLEERAEREGLYSTSVERLKSGQEKISYRIGTQINRSVDAARVALGASNIELDRLIKLFEGRKTDDLEVVATLYAVWNDALAEGKTPDDDWLVSEFRGNWHEKKERFAPKVLHDWLSWMRNNKLVPSGKGAVTKSQAAFMFS